MLAQDLVCTKIHNYIKETCRNLSYEHELCIELYVQWICLSLNIDVTIIQCFAFGYHTNKISIQKPQLNAVLSISCQFTIITKRTAVSMEF